MNLDLCFVITGPPGSGKSSLIEHLIELGFDGVAEPARAVIAEHPVLDGQGIYDRDPKLFIDLMLSRSVRDAVDHSGAERPVFFDRGLPDLIGYAELFEIDAAAARSAARQYRYEDVVFVLPAWPEIYVTDRDRRMSFRDAALFGDMVRDVYRGLGYTIVDVPCGSVSERVAFVVQAVDEPAEGSRAASAVQLGAAPDDPAP